MGLWNDWADELVPECMGQQPTTKRHMITGAVRGKHPDVIDALDRLACAEESARRAWEKCSALQSILTAERADRMREFQARIREQHDTQI
jgi:hypothetical protein